MFAFLFLLLILIGFFGLIVEVISGIFNYLWSIPFLAILLIFIIIIGACNSL